MGLHEPAGDGEAEPAAGCGAGGVLPPEAVEHAAQHGCREPLSGVLHRHPDLALVRLDEHGDRPVGAGVAERVRQDVEEHPLDLVRRTAGGEVGLDPGLDVDVPGTCFGLAPAEAGCDHAVKLGVAELEPERTLVELGELEEIVDPAKQFDLLWFLASHPRRIFSRDQLMRSVWGYEATLDTGTAHIRRLREKVEDDASSTVLVRPIVGHEPRPGADSATVQESVTAAQETAWMLAR